MKHNLAEMISLDIYLSSLSDEACKLPRCKDTGHSYETEF